MTLLWNKYKTDNSVSIDTEDDILKHREIFKNLHTKEIYDDTVTLCEFHHMTKLHGLYGKVPPLHTAEKQKRWCDRLRKKTYGND